MHFAIQTCRKGGSSSFFQRRHLSKSLKIQCSGVLTDSSTMTVLTAHKDSVLQAARSKVHSSRSSKLETIGIARCSSSLIHPLLHFVQTQRMRISGRLTGQDLSGARIPSCACIVAVAINRSVNHRGQTSSIEFAVVPQNRQFRAMWKLGDGTCSAEHTK